LRIINRERWARKKISRNLESNPNHTAKTPLVQKWVSVKRLPADHTKIATNNFLVFENFVLALLISNQTDRAQDGNTYHGTRKNKEIVPLRNLTVQTRRSTLLCCCL
jgi:hypothetical protein